MSSITKVERPPIDALARQPLRVLLVTQASGGGVGRHFLDLAQELTVLGHHVHGMYAPRKLDTSFRQRLDQGNLPPMLELPMRRAIHPLDPVDLYRMIRHAKALGPFDIVHGHSSKGGALARLAARALGIASVYTPNAFVTLDPLLPAWQRSFYAEIERWLAQTTDAIVAVSHDEVAHAKNQLRIDPRKVHLISNAIKRPSFPDRNSVRNQLGFHEDEVVFGFVGRFSHQKAPEVMLEAFDQVAAQHAQVRLLMIGNGPLDAQVQQRVKESPFADRMTLLGDVVATDYMPAFDVFCLSSRFEGMPYVYLETLAAGLPIVSTDVGGASMCVAPGKNGTIVPRDDPGALADAMRSLLDPALRQAYGAASLTRSDRFTLRGMTECTVEVYRTILASRSAAGWVRP